MVRLNKVKLVLQEKEKRVAENGDMKTRSASFNKEMNEGKDEQYEYTLDGSVDIRGRPAAKGKTGGWVGGVLVLGTQYFFVMHNEILLARVFVSIISWQPSNPFDHFDWRDDKSKLCWFGAFPPLDPPTHIHNKETKASVFLNWTLSYPGCGKSPLLSYFLYNSKKHGENYYFSTINWVVTQEWHIKKSQAILNQLYLHCLKILAAYVVPLIL